MVLSGLAAQQFRPTRTHLLPANGASIAVGDVDRDGHPDLIFGGDGLAFARNLGRTFVNETTPRLPPAAGTPLPLVSDVDLVDVDNDGDLDLVVGSFNSRSSMIHLNDGEGFFDDQTSSTLPPSNVGVTHHLIADVDLDGDADVLVDTTSGPDRLLRNDGTGTFTDVSASQLPGSTGVDLLAVGDLDGDLDPDLVVGPTPRLWINDGAGRFTPGPFLAHNLILTETTLLLSQPNGRFAPAPNNGVPSPLRVFDFADIDDDGDIDIVGYRLLLNDGNGVFTDATTGAYASLAALHRIAIVLDVDRDADRDIVFAAGTCHNCSPQVMLNHRVHLAAPAPPGIGVPYDLEVFATRDALQDPVLAMTFGSLAPADWVLPGLGWIGISPTTATLLPTLLFPTNTNKATLTVPVPPSPGLWGTELYYQALVLMQDGRVRRTNAIIDVVR
ncbi:MAG: VCBS repeat-containing protein [bacterium]|nr:VCBS repeat-containing protein [bacterium]